jgi:hypothetical protein
VPAHAVTDTLRLVKRARNDIVPVTAKLCFPTVIILPEKQEIPDLATGDKEFWIEIGSENEGAQALCCIYDVLPGIRSKRSVLTDEVISSASREGQQR